MPDTGHQRLFFAVWPPSPVIAGLAKAIEPVQADSPTWLRWQPTERWHVTVLFLGDRDAQGRAEAADTARAAALDTAPAPLAVTGFGRFGSVLWAGVTGAGWLDPVHRDLSRRLQPRRDRDRFRAHVTLARARGHRVSRELLDRMGAYEGPGWTATELTLVASTTGPHPRYDVIERFPFAPPSFPELG